MQTNGWKELDFTRRLRDGNKLLSLPSCIEKICFACRTTFKKRIWISPANKCKLILVFHSLWSVLQVIHYILPFNMVDLFLKWNRTERTKNYKKLWRNSFCTHKYLTFLGIEYIRIIYIWIWNKYNIYFGNVSLLLDMPYNSYYKIEWYNIVSNRYIHRRKTTIFLGKSHKI